MPLLLSPGAVTSSTTTTSATPPPTVSLAVNPMFIASGGSSTRTWSSTDATSCTASGAWSGAKAVSGSQSSGALTASSSYSLTCTGLGGSASDSATVAVSGTPPPPPVPTVSFAANPTSIASGGSSTLTWSSTNATSCTASGGWSGAKATSGNLSTGALTSTSTFSLACTGSGGAASASATVTISVPPTGSLDFSTRCAEPGVIKCVGFDSASDIAGGYGSNSGIFSGATTPALDTSVKGSGASSLKFTIPSNSPADTSGSYFTNFSNDLLTQFGENSEFYIQWRQRFSPEFLNTIYQGGNGWKQAIIGTGDKPGGNLFSSCTDLETVVQNTGQRGFPQMYNSCTGSASHGPYYPFEEPFGAFDFKLQNTRPSPYCLYSQGGASSFSPNGNCFGYAANEWMTFQVKIKTGPRVNGEWTNSVVTLWVARENQAPELVSNFPINLTAGIAADDQKFGKVWLLPYHTNKSSAQAHPTAFTWYDELIIARTKIADPTPTGSSLAALAASMQPGQWANFTMGGLTSSLVFAAGPATQSLLTYAARGHWDGVHKKFQYAGTSHTSGVFIQDAGGLITWDEAANQWTKESYSWSSLDPGHTYYHNTVNSSTGDLYFRKFNSAQIMRRAYGATGQNSWQTGQVANHPAPANQVAGGLEWFPELNNGGGGLVFVDQLGASWSNAALTSWSSTPTFMSGGYQNWIARAGGSIYWGGGDQSSAMYRLSPTGAVTAMPNTPLQAGVNKDAAIVLSHPNRTDLLLFGTSSGGPIHRFNGSTWSNIGAHQIGGQFWIGFTVPEYGVIVFLRHLDASGTPSAIVYKP